MMEHHTLEYTHGMPDVLILPGQDVRVTSTILLPDTNGGASLCFHAVPFRNDEFPEQWFYGFRLDLDVHSLQHYKHSKVVAAARERAIAISEKLRIAQHDFAQAHVGIKGALPSSPGASDTHQNCVRAEQTVRHGTSTGLDGTTSFASPPLPLTQVICGTPPVQFTEEGLRTPVCVAAETERSDLHERAGTLCCPPTNDVGVPSLSPHIRGDISSSVHHVTTPGQSLTRDRPPLSVTTAPNAVSSHLDSSAAISPSKTSGPDETPTPADESRSLLLACILAGAPAPSVTSLTEPLSPTNPAENLPGLAPPSPLPSSPSLEPLLANKDAQASVNRKRKRQDQLAIVQECQQDIVLKKVAARISSAILLGGRKYKSSTFETWKQDLWLLNPDRAELTLDGLLTQQRTYTEALLCQGIVARIIHSWCLIAHEYQLATSGRGRSTRRDQKEIRLSLRCRKLGVLFLEVINQLFSQPNIGVDAYKVCPAIAAAASVDDPFPIPSTYRDLSVGRLKFIASLVVKHLVADQEKSWMKISAEHAVDPAAQIATSDFSYDHTKHALGLQAAPLSSTTKTVDVSTCTQAEKSGEELDDVLPKQTNVGQDVQSSRREVVENDTFWDTIGAVDDSPRAIGEQAPLFGNNMDTNAWEWDNFLDYSLMNHQSPSDTVS